jgi:transcriptional regulator with XRE-family HTH domain
VNRKQIFDENGVKAFAKRLKEVRKARNYTQERLAFEADIELSQIARIETSRINPTLSTILRIAKTLGVHPKELFDTEF